MTFVEAAIEVLKREGKPLSSRRLADLAVKLNLLSVVGRDPESTMQQRLDDALDRQGRHPDLVRLQPDTFGLHAYPSQPYPGNGAPVNGTPAATAAPAEQGSGEPKKGRRRRRRGRRGEDGEGADTAAPAGGETEAEEAAADAGEAEGEATEGEAAAAAPEGEAPAAEAGGAAGEKRRRRRRGGRGRRRREGGPDAAVAETATGAEADADADGDADEDEPAAAASPPIPDELPSEAAAAGTPSDEIPAAGDDAELLDEAAAGPGDDADDVEVDEIDEHTGPLLAPSLGAEDVTRTEDDRVVRPEILGSRDDRRHRGDRHKGGRDRHKDRGERKPHEAKPHERAHEAKPHHDRPHDRPHHDRPHEPRPSSPPPPSSEPRTGGLIDLLLDILRGADGRPMHVRQLADAAVKRRADDKTQPADLVRLVRAALVREQRDREADGLRPRVRSLGGGNYVTPDRKLDPELMQAEREFGAAAARLRDATRAAVRRRLGRMSPPAFDALGRTLADKLGITGLELLRRGEGVTYWGGTRAAGVGTVRTLVAFRAGEGELNRRAVGELRAGLAAKGYDEGLLLAAGRPNAEALAELKQGGVTLYDAAALATLVVKHGLGVRRASMPIDYLDVELFGELQEG